MGSYTTVKLKGWSVHSQHGPCRPRPVWGNGCGTLDRQWLESARRPHKKTKMLASFPKPGKDIGDAKHWRTIALLSHLGKAWFGASVRSTGEGSNKVPGPFYFGSLPGRSTRDPVFERFTSPGHQASRRSCLLAGFLFDLEKAFDTMPRDRLWTAVASAAELKGLSVVLEAGHAGTCYIIRNSLGRPITKVHVTLEVRHCSVEGPLCFILCVRPQYCAPPKLSLSLVPQPEKSNANHVNN